MSNPATSTLDRCLAKCKLVAFFRKVVTAPEASSSVSLWWPDNPGTSLTSSITEEQSVSLMRRPAVLGEQLQQPSELQVPVDQPWNSTGENMLTKLEALELVLNNLRQMSTADDPFVIVDSETIERPFGWVFFYNSKKFLETGEFSYRLAGNGPVIVNKHVGTIESFGASKPLLDVISEYERRWAGKHSP